MELFLQVTHVRSVHTSGFGQLQEAVAVETEPARFSVFRTQQNDPVNKSLTGQILSMTSQNTMHLPFDAHLCLYHISAFFCNFSLPAHWSVFPGIPV